MSANGQSRSHSIATSMSFLSMRENESALAARCRASAYSCGENEPNRVAVDCSVADLAEGPTDLRIDFMGVHKLAINAGGHEIADPLKQV